MHLDSQLVLVVRGGATMVLNTSTANGEKYVFQGNDYTARTPTGDFAVWYTHGTGWQDGELGEMWRPMYYDGNYAIHGSSVIPPWPASHACARRAPGHRWPAERRPRSYPSHRPRPIPIVAGYSR